MAKTPTEWLERVKNYEITEEILGACIFAINRKIEYYIDKKNKYRRKAERDQFNNSFNWMNIYNAKQMRDEMYELRDDLLCHFLEPLKEIHTIRKKEFVCYNCFDYTFRVENWLSREFTKDWVFKKIKNHKGDNLARNVLVSLKMVRMVHELRNDLELV